MNRQKLIREMIEYERGAVHRVHHFLKVNAFAGIIAEGENIDENTKHVLDIASLMHDIGIKPSLEKYGSSAGEYQQREGVRPASEMLKKLGADDALIERVCYLIAHHHTYANIVGIDYQILVEADFLVNAMEEDVSREGIENMKNNIFKTKTGTELLCSMYL